MRSLRRALKISNSDIIITIAFDFQNLPRLDQYDPTHMSRNPKMPNVSANYGPEVQKIPAYTPIEDIIYLLKRDGGVFLKQLIPVADVDQAWEECRERLENDVEWNGSFFPKQTQRASALLALSPTYAKTQVMNSVYQQDDERDKNRESAVGLFVAGSKVTKENRGTQFIPRSRLWGTNRDVPPRVEDCIYAEVEKGDAFIMLASAYHAGGHNTTKDKKRLVFATFVTRGYLRQEENQFLPVPQEIAKQYDQPIQEFMGYTISKPACKYVNQLDPIFVLRPELKGDDRPTDF
ncbi:Dioxygenase swnH1 [Colletotrichum shisoi]|uniref:Dioxygenase swnH1 n=1 Tax=Colletotrichum shisoi TaxID=2078593 RepID=A0A5Q4BMB3_9PEZI|nr:Dioxygenase swnH1 [Colletotrichum shisoi]